MKQLTKAQELEKLNQIIEIINEAGPGSYLAMSFEGFEALTRDNIESDFGRSYPIRVRELETRVDNLVNKGIEERKEAIKKADELKALLDLSKRDLTAANKAADEALKNLTEKEIERLQLDDELDTTKKELDAAKAQILELKAKLYDYITAAN